MLKTAVFLALAIVLTGCGSTAGDTATGGNTGSSNPVSYPQVPGQWSFVLNETSNPNSPYAYVFANITQSQGTFTASGQNNDFAFFGVEPGTYTRLTGTLSGVVTASNNVTVTVPLVLASGEDTDTFTATGAVSGNAMSGTWTSSSGDSGTWTAYSEQLFNATYAGTLYSKADFPATSYHVTLSLSQNPNYTLVAAANITGSQCFASVSFSPAYAVGGSIYLEHPDSCGQTLVISGIAESSSAIVNGSAQELSVEYQAGSDSGFGTLTLVQ